MVDAYTITYLKPNLIFIVWNRHPTRNEEIFFLDEHKEQLNNAEEPLYFISDLRRGRIMTVTTIRQLAILSEHENYGAGSAFSESPISQMMVETFRKLSIKANEKGAMFQRPEEALASLEAKKPDITEGIDWDEIIK